MGKRKSNVKDEIFAAATDHGWEDITDTEDCTSSRLRSTDEYDLNIFWTSTDRVQSATLLDNWGERVASTWSGRIGQKETIIRWIECHGK